VRILAARSVVDVGYLMVETTFALYTQQRFDLQAKHTGLVLSYAGLLSVLVQLLLVPRLAKKVSESTALVGGVGLMSFSLVVVASSSSVLVFLASMAPLAIGRALFRTYSETVITKCALPEDNGSVSGASDAAESCCRVIAPALGGTLMQWHGVAAPAAAGAIATAVGAGLLHLALMWALKAAAVSKEA